MGHEQRMNSLEQQRRIANFERKIGGVKPHKVYFESGCPMCGLDKFAVRYCEGKDMMDPDPNQCPIIGQHLHVVCGTCAYSWLEQTLEQSKETSETPKTDDVLHAAAAALVELKSMTEDGNFFVIHRHQEVSSQHPKSEPCPVCQAIIELSEVVKDNTNPGDAT
jgi:hypothetical protein